CSPATLTSTSTSVPGAPCRPSCSNAESLATEWISRHIGRSCRTLRLCRLPMKSHSKASPQRSCLAARSCWRFSPTSLTPASARAPISSTGTYLVAARISIPEPAISLARSRLAAILSGSRPWIRPGTSGLPVEPDQARLAPRVAVAAVGEEEIGLAAGAEVRGIHRLDSCLAQLPARLLPEVDLVAAGPDARTDRRGGRLHRGGAAGGDPLLEATAPAVQDRGAPLPSDCDRQAVGAEDEADSLEVGDHVPVGLGRSVAVAVEGEIGAVNLAGADDRAGIDSQGRQRGEARLRR